MPEIVQIGPIMLRFDWILLAISGFAGYLAIKRKWKQSDLRQLPFMDKLSNAIIIVFLVWKISPVLFTPSIVWNYPLGLLTMTGSFKGLWMGGALAVVYLDSSLRQFKVPKLVVADWLSLGAMTMVSVYSLLGWQYGNTTGLPWGISIENPEFSYHPVNTYTLFVSIPILIWLWKKYDSFDAGKITMYMLAYSGIGFMLVSFFKQKTVLYAGLSGEQLVYIGMVLTSFILSLFLNRNNRQVSQQHANTGILPSKGENE